MGPAAYGGTAAARFRIDTVPFFETGRGHVPSILGSGGILAAISGLEPVPGAGDQHAHCHSPRWQEQEQKASSSRVSGVH